MSKSNKLPFFRINKTPTVSRKCSPKEVTTGVQYNYELFIWSNTTAHCNINHGRTLIKRLISDRETFPRAIVCVCQRVPLSGRSGTVIILLWYLQWFCGLLVAFFVNDYVIKRCFCQVVCVIPTEYRHISFFYSWRWRWRRWNMIVDVCVFWYQRVDPSPFSCSCGCEVEVEISTRNHTLMRDEFGIKLPRGHF